MLSPALKPCSHFRGQSKFGALNHTHLCLSLNFHELLDAYIWFAAPACQVHLRIDWKKPLFLVSQLLGFIIKNFIMPSTGTL